MIEGTHLLLLLWAASTTAIIGIFRIMEDTATPDAKRKVADWIKSIATKSISQTVVESPRWFIEAFDRIFGDRHLTRRCFLRSCVASILTVFVMTVVWAVLDPTSWLEYLLAEGKSDAIFFILFAALILNLVPDYLSLLETRWILRIVAHAGVKKLIVLLVLDVIITGAIFVSGMGIIVILIGYSEGYPTGVVEFVDDMLEFLSACILAGKAGETSLTPGIFFYSTYFTSVWFYLFVASNIATKFLYSLGRVGNRVMGLLKVEEKPFQSMGLIAVGFLTLAFAISAIMGAIG